MVNISDFKTRTEFHPRVFPRIRDDWPIGIDIGYSGVKVISPCGAFCFPSYARKLKDENSILKSDSETDIYYKDEDGLWCVGETAYEQLSQADSVESDTELFGRNRYYSKIFLIVARTGIAMACMKNEYGGYNDGNIVLQTGLPPRYLDDSNQLTDVLSGVHKFELKVGKGDWQRVTISIAKNFIQVMSQPKGTLISASIKSDGRQTANAKDFFTSNVIIPDTGFGTFDVFTITKGVVTNQDTFPDLGMKEVFSRTCEGIKEKYGANISVPELQNYLLKGTIPVFDFKSRTRAMKGFSDIIIEKCEEVCHESVDKIISQNNFCRDTDYIIPAGGAYDIWKDTFNAEFKAMEGLTIIPGNLNDQSLANVFSNARGYYFNIAMRKQ